ncbi:allantoin racemase [Paracoccus pantotrophus]|uniref:Allantoin racemase n=2 Tax=Paracoccaceae TaxID=31989 RepID=A0AAE6TX87_PARPN|nr:hydantoin racemase [Paracoccus pantotrophus]RKS51955.1 allantoin racemase [Paracoccus pantotrophus]
MTDLPDRPCILYQLVSPLHKSAGEAEIARRLSMLKLWAPGADIHIASPESGPAAVQSATDIAMVYPHLQDSARGWQDRGIDAVVIGCFSDPGVEALAEISGLPVIGPGEAGLLAAVQMGGRFAVLSSNPTPPGLRRRVRAIGAEPMFVTEALVSGSVADLVRDPDPHLPSVIAQARNCVEQGAEVLVIGCFAMSFAPDLPRQLSAATGVPVINPVIAGLKAAEAAVFYHSGLSRGRCASSYGSVPS